VQGFFCEKNFRFFLSFLPERQWFTVKKNKKFKPWHKSNLTRDRGAMPAWCGRLNFTGMKKFAYQPPETKLWEMYDYIQVRIRYEKNPVKRQILYELSAVALEKALPY